MFKFVYANKNPVIIKMYLLGILLIYFVTFLQIRNALSDTDNYSEELKYTFDFHKRHYSRVAISDARHHAGLLLALLLEYEENYLTELDQTGLIKATVFRCHYLIRQHLQNCGMDITEEQGHILKEQFKWPHSDEVLTNNKWEPLRRFLSKVSLTKIVLDNTRVQFENQITDYPPKRRLIIERLQNVLILQKIYFKSVYLIEILFEEVGYDEDTYTWITGRDKPFEDALLIDGEDESNYM